MRPLEIDPTLFQEDAIAPETRAANEVIEQALKQQPSIMELGAAEVRERRRAGEGVLATQPAHPMAEWHEAGNGSAAVPVRVFNPGGDLNGVYLHIHGGGHTLGSADAQDQTLASMAETLSVAVVSVEYRLAPENPWPIPADDCEVAAVWLAKNAEELFGTDRICIGGESAGAHLCAVTILRLRNRHGLTPFSGANLIYGVYDLSGLPSALTWGERNLVINTPIIRWFSGNLLPTEKYDTDAKRDPEISPLYANLEGLCPALFTVGTLDPLIDDTLLMSAKWAAAGNDTQLEIYPGGIHAFNMIPGLPIADEANDKSLAFLAAAFAR